MNTRATGATVQIIKPNRKLNLVLATLLPLVAAAVQWALWPYLPPLTWLLFYPAVYCSAWLGGLLGGLIATMLATMLGIYVFMPHQFSWEIQDYRHIYSAAIFAVMGVLFSWVHERLRHTKEELERINELNLEVSQARLRLALESANAGIWEWNLLTNLNEWSDGLWDLYGLPAFSQQPSYDTWLGTVHPDNQAEAVEVLNKAVSTGDTILLEWRVANLAEDEERWLMARGEPELNPDGVPSLYRGIVIDITKRKQMEKALQDREQGLDFALSTLGAGAWELNLNSHKARRTLLHDQIFGYPTPLAEWTYEQFLDHVLPEDKAKVAQSFQTAIANQSNWEFECRIRRVDGEIRWIFAKGQHRFDDKARPLCLAGIVQDITESKYMAIELQRWADAFRYCAHGIAIGDPTTNTIRFCNQAFATMEGYGDPKEVIGLPILSLYPPDIHEQIKRHIQTADKLGKIGFETFHRRKNGVAFDVQVDLVSVKSANNTILYRVATVQDISQRKRAEARLLLQSKALGAAANAIMITDPTGTIEWVNPAFTKLTGYTEDESIGNNTNHLFKCNIRHPTVHEDVWATISKGQIWQGEIVYPRKDGSLYTEEQTITPVIDEQGLIHHYIAIKQDISERKQNEADLERYQYHLEQLVEERTYDVRAAREEAERLTQVKSAFLANMSHEIRSPMNAVLGFCYLLEQRPLEDEARQLVRKVRYAGQTLLAIINDILDFSKIEAGHLEIEHTPFRLSDLLDQIAALMSATAKDKDLELIINPSPFEVEYLIGDSLRLQQVLVNLVSNAIKFTEAGEVELAIKVTNSQEDKNARLLFTVRDTGIGISLDKQAEIFTAFTQADTTISRRFGGSGLGLAISQRLVSLMGGALQVESKLGKGSKFWFELALERDLQVERTLSYLTGLDLLVADDSVTALAAIVNTIKSLGWTADTVDSGEAAYSQTLARWENKKPYDVLLLDWKMLGQDGLITAQAIKQSLKAINDKQKLAPIVIMVSAYSREELLAQPGMCWVDTVLSKPVTPSTLYNAITDVINKREPSRTLVQVMSSIATQLRRISGVKVLVVDDSELNREIAQSILTLHGAVVSLAGDGQDAIDWLLANHGSVDIILMDVQMPRMDGYEATRLIRQVESCRKIPIVALTAGAFTSDQDTARESGMDDFVSKPFNVEQLIAVIQRLAICCQIAECNDAQSTRLTGLIASKLEEPGTELLESPVIDINEGNDRFGEQISYYTYLSKFADSYANAGNDIAGFIRVGDVGAASALTHRLKGVAGNLALKAVETKASELESLLMSVASATNVTDALQQAIDEACAVIYRLTVKESGVLDEKQLTKAIDENPDELVSLLESLLQALDQDSPSAVEPVLLQLHERLTAAEIALIENQLTEFDFRAAEVVTNTLIQQIKSR